MILRTSNIVLVASSLLHLFPLAVVADSSSLVTGSPELVDCYSSIPKDFVNNGTYKYQSDGYCSQRCIPLGYPVMALINSNDCWCGMELPSNSTKANTCDLGCAGFGQHPCGGANSYSVYLTGLPFNNANGGSSSSSTTSAATSTTAAAVTVITQAGQTIVVTASSDPSASAKSGGSTNTAGIAAGVVVGVVILAAIIGAAVFFMRRRQKQRVEEEYRRNAEITRFTQSKPSSMSSDARWDSEFMAERRQSNGSIADAQDFSRRILQVTNPDR